MQNEVEIEAERERLRSCLLTLDDDLIPIKYKVESRSDTSRDLQIIGTEYYINRTARWSVTYSVKGANKNLEMTVAYGELEGYYGNGIRGQCYVTIQAKYDQVSAKLEVVEYSDPKGDWKRIGHGHLKAVLFRLAADLNAATHDQGLKVLLETLVTQPVARITLGGYDREVTLAEIVLEELEIVKDYY